MKTLKWIALLLIGACLILPGLIGSRIEQSLRNEIENLPNVSFWQMEIKLVDFEGGWFTSRAILEAKLDPALIAGLTPSKPDDGSTTDGQQQEDSQSSVDSQTSEALQQFAEEIEFLNSSMEFGVDFHHGPLGYDQGFFLGWLSWNYAPTENNPTVNELETELGLPYVFELRGVSNFFGTFNIALQIPPFKAEDPYDQPLVTEFSGLQMHGFYATSDSSIALSGEFTEFSLNTPQASLRFTGFELDQQGKVLTDSALFLGKADFSVSDIELIVKETDQNVLLKKVKASSIQDYGSSAEVLDIEAKFSAQELVLGDDRVENSVLGMSIKDLSLNGLVQYNQLVTSLAGGDAEPDIPVAEIEATLREILAHSPRITFMPIQFSLNDQSVSGGFDIGVNGSGLNQVQDLLNREPTAWLNDIDAQAMLSLDKNLAQQLAFTQTRAQIEAAVGDNPNVTAEQIDEIAESQVPALLDNLAQQGMLKEEGDNYAASLTYIKGELTLNGQDIPLDALLQR